MKSLLLFLMVLIIASSCQNTKLFRSEKTDSRKDYLQGLDRLDMDELVVSFDFMLHCTESYWKSSFYFHGLSADSVGVCEINFSDTVKCKTQAKDHCLKVLQQLENEINSSNKGDCSITRDTVVQVRVIHRKEEKERIFYFQKNLEGLSFISKLTND